MRLTRELCDDLYRKHAPGAFRRAQRMLGNVSDADEVVHDVFVAIFEQAERVEAKAMSAYLYGAVTHACLNRIRNRRNRQRLDQAHQSTLHSGVDSGTAPEYSVALRELIERLPERLAEVAIYHYVDELSYREIAQVVGCSHRHIGQLLVQLAKWAQQEKLTWQP